MRATRILRTPLALTAASFMLATAAPVQAYEFEGSALENGIANTLDITIVRPLASLRVLIGGVLLIPAAIMSSPGGNDSVNEAYDLLVREPMEYAFDRKLGDF